MINDNPGYELYGRRANDPASRLLAAGAVNWHLTILSHLWRPPTDLYETEDKFVIRVEIPGMREGEFAVNVENNILTIQGKRPDVNEKRAYHQMEIHFGEFRTDVELPNNVDVNTIQADYEDGFLVVVMPKTQPKQLNIGD